MINRVNKVLVLISGVGLISLMLLITAGVFTRYILGYSIPAAYAITEEYLMPLTIFTALGYAYYTGIFPKVDVFVEKFRSDKAQKIVQAIITMIEFILFAMITYFFFQYTLYAFSNKLGFSANSINFPLGPMYLLITIAFLWKSILIMVNFVVLLKDEDK